MKQGKCWCDEKETVYWLWDAEHEPVIGINGENAMLRVRVSPDQGRVGLPISYCPFCGRQLEEDIPRCPEGLNAKVVRS